MARRTVLLTLDYDTTALTPGGESRDEPSTVEELVEEIDRSVNASHFGGRVSLRLHGPTLDEHGDVEYDLETHGWVEVLTSDPSFTKTVGDHTYEIDLNPHGMVVLRDGAVVWVNPVGHGADVVGPYRATVEAIAWEVDHGLGST